LAGPSRSLTLGHDVALLISSGRDWTDLTKRIAARAPDLDIFSQAFVLREPTGWVITAAGLDFLAAVERPAAAPVAPEAVLLVSAVEVEPVVIDPPVTAPGVPLVGLNTSRRRPAFHKGRALRRLDVVVTDARRAD
jgi:hypothetical protein